MPRQSWGRLLLEDAESEPGEAAVATSGYAAAVPTPEVGQPPGTVVVPNATHGAEASWQVGETDPGGSSQTPWDPLFREQQHLCLAPVVVWRHSHLATRPLPPDGHKFPIMF